MIEFIKKCSVCGKELSFRMTEKEYLNFFGDKEDDTTVICGVCEENMEEKKILVVYFSYFPANVRKELAMRFEDELIFKHISKLDNNILNSDEYDRILFFGKNFSTDTIELLNKLIKTSNKKLGYLRFLNNEINWFKGVK